MSIALEDGAVHLNTCRAERLPLGLDPKCIGNTYTSPIEVKVDPGKTRLRRGIARLPASTARDAPSCLVLFGSRFALACSRQSA
jgi:hypothetical protein